MLPMPIADLKAVGRELAETGKIVKVLWQRPESLAFVARGRDYRSEFHLNPSDEIMYMISGQMNLHYRTPDGNEEIAVLPEGSAIYTAAGIAHSPRFPSSALLLVTERMRRPGEIDRFHWYCPQCDAFLHEETFVVSDYRADPVSKAYARFFESEEFRTCKACGHVMPDER
jgi:3-hydroxyanthranilate 3,4-dioxygenase